MTTTLNQSKTEITGNGATARNGDKWTGETITEGSSQFFRYVDAAGREYESKESPAHWVDMTAFCMTSHGIMLASKI